MAKLRIISGINETKKNRWQRNGLHHQPDFFQSVLHDSFLALVATSITNSQYWFQTSVARQTFCYKRTKANLKRNAMIHQSILDLNFSRNSDGEQPSWCLK